METVVFGKRGGEHMASGEGAFGAATTGARELELIGRAAPSHEAVQQMMWKCAGIERSAAGLAAG